MKRNPAENQAKPSGGGRIIASLKEAVDWAEGKDVAVRSAQPIEDTHFKLRNARQICIVRE